MRTWTVIFLILAFGCSEEGDESSSSSGTCSVATASEVTFKTQSRRSLEDMLISTMPQNRGNLYVKSTQLPKGAAVIVGRSKKCGGGFEVVRNKESMSVSQFAASYNMDPCVEILEYDRKIKLAGVQPAASFNDTNVSSQFHLDAINFSNAYDLFYNVTDGISNEEVVIAVLDSGIDGDHEDLVDKFWDNTDEIASNGVDDDGNGVIDDVRGALIYYDDSLQSMVVSGDPEPQSWGNGGEFHGTHVAGLAAATLDNLTGVAGIGGPNVVLMDINIFGDSSNGSISAALQGIEYAINNGADVINISLAGQGESPFLSSAIQDAVNANVVVVIAAGNEGERITSPDGDFPIIPAIYGSTYSGALTVGSSYSSSLGRTDYSNYSSTYVEIFAPGSDEPNRGVLSTYLGPTVLYDRSEGTSMATPLVSGAAALTFALLRERGGSPTAAEVETYLRNSASTQSALTNCVSESAHLDLESLYNVLDAL